MLAVDPSAKVAPGAVIGADVKIGPYCVIGPNVALGDGCELIAHVHLAGHTTIGPGTVIYPFASLGTPPQSVHYKGGPTRLTIGAKCQIRESVTINTGTEKGGGVTSVGDNAFLMVGAHVAHDCRVGSNVVFANNAAIGGHVEIQDNVFLGGHCVVHQFTRLGESAMVAGYSAVRAAYNTLFEGEGEFSARVDAVAAAHADVPQVAQIVAFLRSAKRPVMMTRLRGHVDDFE